MSSKKLLLTTICFLFLFSDLARANSPLSINTEIDKKIVTIGDIVTYTIILKHDLDLISSTPKFDTIKSFNLIEKTTSKPSKLKNGLVQQKYSVKIRADQVGIYTIPPIRVPFKVKNKETGEHIPGEVSSKQMKIEVASVLRLQGEPTDIKDIKNIVEVDTDWISLVFWGLNSLLLITLLYLLWKYRKIRHSNHVTKTHTLPTHTQALRELDILEKKGLLEDGKEREHFFELSEIFRRYLGKRYLFPASDWTTEEITKYFKNQEKIELASRNEANRILKKSDLIKFAKAQALPDTDEIESIRSFIKLTQESSNLGLYPN